jgi:hypothetical protein
LHHTFTEFVLPIEEIITQQITDRLQIFINNCLWCIINVRWPKTISNDDLWKITKQQPIAVQIKRRKWHWSYLKEIPWIHREGSTRLEPLGARRRIHPKTTWKRAVEEEATEVGKTWSEVNRIAVDRIRWRRFTDVLCSSGGNRK